MRLFHLIKWTSILHDVLSFPKSEGAVNFNSQFSSTETKKSWNYLILCVGNKTNNINVVYTPWSNLKKTADMDVGQVGFHKSKEVGKPLISPGTLTSHLIKQISRT